MNGPRTATGSDGLTSSLIGPGGGSPGTFDMYRVAVKRSAVAENPGVRSRAEVDDVLEFPSEGVAREFAAARSEDGPDVRLQAPASQDPMRVDAYLVRDNQAAEWSPDRQTDEEVIFPVGANVYGGIGQGILGLDGRPSPALTHYFSEVASPPPAGEVTSVDHHPTLPVEMADVGWHPDLRIHLADTASPPTTYFAEIKSGNASFERDQRRAMQRVARDAGVLKIRVRLNDLPEEYAVRIDEVTPTTWPE